MADRIVDYARLVMHKKRASPFQMAAMKEGLYYKGGVRAHSEQLHFTY